MYKFSRNLHLHCFHPVSHSRGPYHLQWHKSSFWVRLPEERYMKMSTPFAQCSGSRHLQHTLLGWTSIRKLPNSCNKKDKLNKLVQASLILMDHSLPGEKCLCYFTGEPNIRRSAPFFKTHKSDDGNTLHSRKRMTWNHRWDKPIWLENSLTYHV